MLADPALQHPVASRYIPEVMTEKKRIAVIPGDGIGKEVIPAALKVVEATGAAVEFTTFDWSADRYLKDGATIPPDGFTMLARDFDAIFVGALGDPRVPTNIHAKEILLGMRFRLDLYANVRPVKLLDASLCPLKNCEPADINFTVIRENTEGLYVDMGGTFKQGTPDELAVNQDVNTYKGVERIIRYAFEYRSEEHTSELQSPMYLVCRLLLEKQKRTEWHPAGQSPLQDERGGGRVGAGDLGVRVQLAVLAPGHARLGKHHPSTDRQPARCSVGTRHDRTGSTFAARPRRRMSRYLPPPARMHAPSRPPSRGTPGCVTSPGRARRCSYDCRFFF